MATHSNKPGTHRPATHPGQTTGAGDQPPAPPVTLSSHVQHEIDRWVAKFPEGRQRSAVLGALHAAQHEHGGYLTRELMEAVAAYLELPAIQVFEVATFYSMYETRPVGRHSISVCTNISCMLCGGERILEHVEKRLGIKAGESTPDGKFYLKVEEECLAACTGAPMMMIDHRFHENLTPAKVDEILASIDDDQGGHGGHHGGAA